MFYYAKLTSVTKKLSAPVLTAATVLTVMAIVTGVIVIEPSPAPTFIIPVPVSEQDDYNYDQQLRYPIVQNPIFGNFEVNNGNNRTPVILLWVNIAPRYSMLDDLPESYYSNQELNCSALLPFYGDMKPCYFTNNRNWLQDANVVLLNVHEWRYTPESVPTNRSRAQYWTYFESESPVHLYHSEWRWSRKYPNKSLNKLKNVFNWTMTYRLDSTIPVTYGRFEPLKRPDFTRNYDHFTNKTGHTLYMASSYCGDRHSHRDEYIEKMLKSGLDVEVIGACRLLGRQSPLVKDPDCKRTPVWSTKDECTRKIGNRYKFFLAFENSLCNDYVTEKFFRAASTDMIPVVLNGANMALIAPPHSYIDAKEFKSPRHLAAYLKKVASNASLFNSYFWWKPYYDVVQMLEGFHYKRSLCQLCAYSHRYLTEELPKPTFQVDDIEDWWIRKGNCIEGRTDW